MTIAEIAVLFVAALGLYSLLAPLRKRLEKRLYSFFRKKLKTKEKTVIDITDYSRRN